MQIKRKKERKKGRMWQIRIKCANKKRKKERMNVTNKNKEWK